MTAGPRHRLRIEAAALATIAAALIASQTHALADDLPPPESYAGSYYCTEEASGGIEYDEALKAWKGVAFRPNEKFILALKPIKSYVQKDYLNRDQPVVDYRVTITAAGNSKSDQCISLFAPVESDGAVTLQADGGFSCNDFLSEYHVSLSKLRYLNIYPVGFSDGIDNRANTPSISGGTCTKID